jgi:hypothetical protein
MPPKVGQRACDLSRRVNELQRPGDSMARMTTAQGPPDMRSW